MLKFKKWLLNNKLIISGVVIGGIIGFIYYIQIECGEGLCVIGANPFNSIVYFALLSGFIMSLIKAKIADDKQKGK
jgi:hypothetical protein